MHVHLPNKDNIKEGVAVLIDGYQVGITVVSLAAGLSSSKQYPHLNPVSAYFYTNVYRWALRHLSLVPLWIGGTGSYCDTHKVWRRRFFYMDEFMPKWLKYILPYVKDEEWLKEEKEFRKFKKYAESAFGKHYRYPSRNFNNFKSQETQETVEVIDSSAS
ncbi:unnamed protein product [Danaus chrysippus]|uniref:(African queen) hypothetical protein n=1 Tax=Danaus chrysippus TaxID=151541 RepID=A0A8J2MEU2_9NEOP|nr:unnamed protein product [Danaus chrysippus]